MEPNNVSVLGDSIQFLALSGSVEEAIAIADRCAELDPLSAPILFWQGWTRFVAEDYPGAIAGFAESAAVDPAFPYPALWTGAARGLLREPREALSWARRAEALDPDSRNTDFLAVLAATYVMGNRPDDARRQLEKIESQEKDDLSFWPQRSYVHGWLGEYDAAAECADHAFAERNPGVIYWGNHPVCDAARAHPRIVANLEALGFPAIRPTRPWEPVEDE
jgi:tetratricopeptide (TPR) repeat protein